MTLERGINYVICGENLILRTPIIKYMKLEIEMICTKLRKSSSKYIKRSKSKGI